MESLISFVIVGVAVVLLLFLLLRTFWLWYWRISEIVALLKSIDRHLTELSKSEEKAELPPAPYREKDGIRLSRHS